MCQTEGWQDGKNGAADGEAPPRQGSLGSGVQDGSTSGRTGEIGWLGPGMVTLPRPIPGLQPH